MNIRCTIIWSCLLAAIICPAISSAAAPQVEVIAKSTKVKVNNETIAVVEKGQKFGLLKSQGAWIAINVGEGEKAKRGWVLASDVRLLPDPSITEDSAAPPEPIDARIAIDLTQFSPNMGPQSAMYFKIRIGNETNEPVEFKVADLQLKIDDQPVPRLTMDPNQFSGWPVYTDPSMRAQTQPSALSFLKDATLAPNSTVEAWLGFNLASLQQAFFTPGALAGKTWIIEGKVGPHPIRFDLRAAEMDLISEKPRPSKLDATVQVIEIGSRINVLNAAKIFELMRTIPADDRGCVLVLKNQECLFDQLATQQFQQQMYQIFPNGNLPVVSNEGAQPINGMYGPQGVFAYGQTPVVASETAAVLTILGRRPNTGAILIKHLGNEAADTRASAARALMQHLNETDVIQALVKATIDGEPTVRAAALSALGGGPSPLPQSMRKDGSLDTQALIKAMSDSVANVRMTAAQTAVAFPCASVRAALIELLDDADFSVKLVTMGSVGTMQAMDAVPKLKILQTDVNAQLKTAAIDALMKLGELTPLDGALAKLDGGTLQDNDFKAIGQARDKRAVEPLIRLLKPSNNNNNYYQNNWVARTLGEIGDVRAVEPLIQSFSFSNRNFQMDEFPRALAKFGDQRAVEPLRHALPGPNEFIQPELRGSIFEALLILKAPKALDECAEEIKKLVMANRQFEINSLLLALGRSKDAKAMTLIEPYLANQQTSNSASLALWELGTKASIAALEARLTDPEFQNAQFLIMNQRWPRTANTVAFLKRISEGKNQAARMAAANALNNLQMAAKNGPGANYPVPVGYLAPSLDAENVVEQWVDGRAPSAANLHGKVVVILLPDTAGAAPDLPVEGNRCLEKFEKQGLILLSLWKYAGWDWDTAAKAVVIRPDAKPSHEEQAVTDLAHSKGIKYRVGLVSTESGLTEKFGGPSGAKVAVVDRAGILQLVRTTDEGGDLESPEFESLLSELLAEPPPSNQAIRIPRQISPPPDVPKLPRSAVLAYAASSFDPASTSWTIPAHHDTIWSVKFAPDGKTVATTGNDAAARIWDLTTGKLRHSLIGHEGNVRHCAFTGDGTQLLTAGFDRTIRMWNAKTGELQKTLTDDAWVYFLSPLADGKTLISASQDARIRYWNLTEGKVEGYLSGHSGTAWTVAAAKATDSNSTIVSGSVDRTVKIWDFPSGKLRHTFSGHLGGVNAVAITNDGKMAASGSGEVIFWDAITGEEKHKIVVPGSFVYDLAYSSDRKTLAVARSNHTVSLYNVETGNLVKQWNRGGWCLDISKDGKYLATGCDDRSVRIWSIGTDTK